MNIASSLSEKIAPDEKLARVISAGKSAKHYKKKIKKADNGEYNVKSSVFLDKRNPGKISVNRISTLLEYEAHQLGLEHQEKHQPDSTYYGFAQLLTSDCHECNCDVEKDDINGQQPYHANIIYSHENKEQQMLITTKLAYYAKFIPHIGHAIW